MKILKYILLLNLLWVTSCKKLDESPDSFISPVNFYETRADAIAALSATYSPVRLNGFITRNYVILGEITTDNMFPLNNSAPRIELDTYVHTPLNGIVRETWDNFYIGITRANTAINKIPNITMDEALKSRLVGEAKFLRAFYYFHLVRLFGDLPIVTEEVSSLDQLTFPKRNPKAEVYIQIIADLEDAEAILPPAYTGADRGRATSGAAKSFLASVYLTLKDYKLAADKANEVMNLAGAGYGLWDNYLDVYDIKNEFGKEAIFDAQFVSGPGGQGGNMIAFMAQENNSVAGRGFGSFQPTPEVYDSYTAADKRKSVFFTLGTDKKYYVNKWIDADATTENQSDNNFPLMRYAEVVLTYAEAYNEVNAPVNGNPAYNAVNSIRQRAGLPLLENLNQNQLREAILQERRLELAFEGSRWFDLVRTGKLVSTLSAKGTPNVKEHHNLYPIPQFHIGINAELAQNPGY
ncbi:RagB/SusD family nutrient uptake outer membrane protein [Pedobacter immunditicola]|uniref:RagB/SusD family nutrient uptake outer membrane protein n=1 Tax=Pedobacter immunditicola TaxID=3133440 RepID=UPI00309B879D